MNGNILWNFPDASTVAIDGLNEVSGSILLRGNLVFKTIGQSGRTVVLGNLEQNKGGSEFHSFECNPPIPLPDLECVDTLSTSSSGSVSTAPTKAPTPGPTAVPFSYQGSAGCCSFWGGRCGDSAWCNSNRESCIGCDGTWLT